MHHIYGTSPIKTMRRILHAHVIENPGHVQSFPFNSNRLSDYNDDATCSPYTTLEFAVYFFLVQNFIGEKSCPFSALKLSMHYHFRSANIAQYVYRKPSLTKGFLCPPSKDAFGSPLLGHSWKEFKPSLPALGLPAPNLNTALGSIE